MSITKEDVEEAVNHIFNQKRTPKEREVIIYRYCKTVGGTIKSTMRDAVICEDKECGFCSQMRKSIEKHFPKPQPEKKLYDFKKP